ncbi:hypothetical protein AMTRI_Chr13g86610 [Amborella trichopoda]
MVTLNGQEARAMVDTAATHNSISDRGVERLGLKLTVDASKIKAVNSAPQSLLGVARDVALKVGNWSGLVNLVVARLNDFEVILGLEVLIVAKTSAILHLGMVPLWRKQALAWCRWCESRRA